MSPSILDSVSPKLPPLSRAGAIQAEAARAGFDWPDMTSVLGKVQEELEELREATARGDRVAVAEELGDLLLVIVNMARRQTLDVEQCLLEACTKFEQRFRAMEASLAAEGKRLEDQSPEALDALWRATKSGSPVS